MSEQQRPHETSSTPTGTDADGPVPAPTGTGQGNVTDRPVPADGAAGASTGTNTPADGSAPGDVDGDPAGPDAADPGPAGSDDAQEQAAADADEASEAAAEATAEVEAEPVPDEPDWKDRYVRSVAELDNVRKRARRDAAAGEARGIAKLAKELLPALDNLDRALAHVDQDAGAGNGDAQLIEGVRIVHREIHAALSQAGIEAYDPTGEPFDPHAHEALTQQPAPEGTAPGTILAVFQAGYRRGDDVLRAAKVVVAG
jgi:molecular chaperone GrpE